MGRKLSTKVKQTAKKWKLGNFTGNFFAVVFGIAITFIGNDLITEHNAQNEVEQAVVLLKNELITNRNEISNIIDRTLLEQQSANYLLRHKGRMDQTQRDSMNKYASIPFQWASYSFSCDAFEMFKASSLFQKMENVNLSFSIFKAYEAIRDSEISINGYNKITENLRSELSRNEQISLYMTDNNREIVEIWEHLLKYPEGVNLLRQIPQIQNYSRYYKYIDVVDHAIAAINAQYYL